MLRKLSKTIVFAIAVIVVAAPFVLAQTSGAGSTGAGSMPSGQTGPGTTSTPSSRMDTGTSSPSSSQMGTMGARDAINATVADVNHQHNTLKLKMQGGETVEFKVPEASLTNLNKGDSVQVSIHKAERQSGMGTQPAQPARPARPESSTPSPGTRSQ